MNPFPGPIFAEIDSVAGHSEAGRTNTGTGLTEASYRSGEGEKSWGRIYRLDFDQLPLGGMWPEEARKTSFVGREMQVGQASDR